MIHGVHLAGRCTGCGECERVCPMEIPVAKIKKKIGMELKQLFDYIPGLNPDDIPPMYTFKVEEAKIEEHEL
jgi:ferredoxin